MKMRKKISVLVFVCLILNLLFGLLVSAEGNGENQAASGVQDAYYTPYAVESWQNTEVLEKSVAAEDIRLNDAAASFPAEVAEDASLSFCAVPPASGNYYLMVYYRPLGEVLAMDALFDVSCGDSAPEAIQLPILWHDSVRNATDRTGNEVTPEQSALTEAVYAPCLSYTDISRDVMTWTLDAGEAVAFTFVPTVQAVEVLGVWLCPVEAAAPYSGEKKPDPVETIVVEAEDYSLKSDSYIRSASVRNAALFPYDTYVDRRNVLDGGTWKTAGQKVIWEFEVKQEGNYRIGLRCQQNAETNKKVFRKIEIDGEVPFEEWEAAGIGYTGSSGYGNWTFQVDDHDAVIHLTPGTHTIAMTVTAGPYEEIYQKIEQLMTEINDLGLVLLRMTAGTTDTNRTWDMDTYMPDAVDRLNAFADRADAIYAELCAIDGEESVYAMDLQTVSEKLRDLTERPETIPNKTEEICRGDSSASKYLGDVLSILAGHALSLDRLYIYGDGELPAAKASFFTSLWESIKRFFWSFTPEAASDGHAVTGDGKEELQVWVGRPSIIVDILQQMVDEDYNQVHGTNIRLAVMPSDQKLVLANAAGTNPDVVLSAPPGLPFSFGCRGALKNLLEYDDFLPFYNAEYQLESLVSTSYGDGVYGAVDSRNFQLLFYRKDILDSLGLEVPDTWEDVEAMMPTLLRSQMNFYIPISTTSSLKGLAVTSPFIYQNGGEIYSSDGLSTAIDSAASIQAITEMTEFYRIYGMEQTVASFYRSFRYGEVPIGIGDFTAYLQLKMAAPELAGQIGVALSPGTEQEDGSILRYQPANSTACMIFNDTEQPEEAWQFLRWWLDSETQLEFSVKCLSTLGQEYQWNTANIQAFSQLPFDSEVKELALEQWLYQREVTPHPASYIVERELSGVWNDVVVSNEALIESLDRAVFASNREIQRKMVEFGYIDEEGHLLREYNTKILEMLYEKLEGGE